MGTRAWAARKGGALFVKLLAAAREKARRSCPVRPRSPARVPVTLSFAGAGVPHQPGFSPCAPTLHAAAAPAFSERSGALHGLMPQGRQRGMYRTLASETSTLFRESTQML